LGDTAETRRRSGDAQRWKFKRFSTAADEKHGERKGGVSQSSPGEPGLSGSTGEKATREWKRDKT
jgi:hypothetical protein